jgi:transcriptional regulator with XRE-family HTH domain
MAVSAKLMEGFAQNLRAYCNRKSSIAEVCRGTQIHRQQFSKYLSGLSFPNAHNLSKICQYLNISAEELFVVNPTSNANVKHDTVGLRSNSEKQLRGLRNGLSPYQDFDIDNFGNSVLEISNQILAGSYYCYFPFPEYKGAVLRTYLRVWNIDGRFLFSRLTRIGHRRDNRNIIARHRHNGSVLASADEVSFIGRNCQSPHHLSFINLERKSTFDGFHFGLAFVRTADNSMACRVALEYLGSIPFDRLIARSLGIVQSNDESVPKHIRLALFDKDGTQKQEIFPPGRADIFANLLEQ